MILFHTPAYAELGKKLATQNGYQVGETEHQTFPDGERYIRIKTKVLDHKSNGTLIKRKFLVKT